MRVVIAEDAALLREGLTRLLEDRGHTICAAVSDGDALLAAVAEHRPDVAVVDIRMPPTHTDEGLRAALTLRHDFPGTGVLVFSQYIETSYSAQLLDQLPLGRHHATMRIFDAACSARTSARKSAIDARSFRIWFRCARRSIAIASQTASRTSPRRRSIVCSIKRRISTSRAALGEARPCAEGSGS